MEQRIREVYIRAFWDMFDREPLDKEHLGRMLEEIKQILYSFVPHRVDIHHMINDDLSGEIDWDTQRKLICWAERFQAPIYDEHTRNWKRTLPQKLSVFLRDYHEHLNKIGNAIPTNINHNLEKFVSDKRE